MQLTKENEQCVEEWILFLVIVHMSTKKKKRKMMRTFCVYCNNSSVRHKQMDNFKSSFVFEECSLSIEDSKGSFISDIISKTMLKKEGSSQFNQIE
jgi:hypothetical protein